MTTSDHLRDVTLTRQPISWAAAAVGAVFLVVGILGFVPGIVTHYGDLKLADHGSKAELLGLFQVSVLHNLVHLAFGIAGLLMASTAARARAFLIGGGIIYGVLWVYGLLVDQQSSANFVPVNTADNWLHLALAVAMVALGVLLSPRMRPHDRASA